MQVQMQTSPNEKHDKHSQNSSGSPEESQKPEKADSGNWTPLDLPGMKKGNFSSYTASQLLDGFLHK